MKNESKKIVITADSLIKVKHKKRVSFRIEWEVDTFILQYKHNIHIGGT